MFFSEKGIKDFLLDDRLSGVDLRVFCCLASFAESQSNEVLMTQLEIGRFLRMDRAQVSRSVLRLSDLDYLKLVKRIGHSKLLMLNPLVVYKGSEENKLLAIKKYNSLTLAGAIVESVVEILKPQGELETL